MRHLLAVLGVWVIGWVGTSVFADESQAPPRTFQYDGKELLATKLKFQAGDKDVVAMVKKLLKEAAKALDQPDVSVVNKPYTPPGGDKHDYMSLSPYWLPDPSKPDGKP